jgi:hypothetical protein
MTGDEIIVCAGTLADPAIARVNAAMDQARWFAGQTCIAVEAKPGVFYTRTLSRAEQAAAITAACELAVIAEGGLRVLGRV